MQTVTNLENIFPLSIVLNPKCTSFYIFASDLTSGFLACPHPPLLTVKKETTCGIHMETHNTA